MRSVSTDLMIARGGLRCHCSKVWNDRSDGEGAGACPRGCRSTRRSNSLNTRLPRWEVRDTARTGGLTRSFGLRGVEVPGQILSHLPFGFRTGGPKPNRVVSSVCGRISVVESWSFGGLDNLIYDLKFCQ